MQRNPTANERHSFALLNTTQQQHDETVKQPTHRSLPAALSTPTATTAAVSTAAVEQPSTSSAVSPALASLVVTDSPHSPSSQLSFVSHSQPSSPASPGLPHDCVTSAAAALSDSASSVGALPVTAAAVGCGGVGRVRVPLSQVVTSLTHRWSMEYLTEAEAGDVDAQCLVAQMYLTGWGALKEDQAEGKRWLQRAKQGGIAGTVNKLELLYLGDRESSGGTATRRVSDEACGYQSGYGNTPQASPSAASPSPASFMPTPTGSSFFASVAATISPKPIVAAAPLARSTSPYAAAAAGGMVSGRLSVPSSERSTGAASGSSGASSGDEHSQHHAQSHHHHHHVYQWHMHHARGHSGELGVSAS